MCATVKATTQTTTPHRKRVNIIAYPKISVREKFQKSKIMADSLRKKGGYRPRAGRPKGSKNQRTLIRERVAEELALKNKLADDIRMLLPMGVRKQGLKALEEVSKEEIEKEVERRLGHHAHKLINAQLSLALGTQHLFRVEETVDEKGKPKRQHVLVTDPDEIRQYLDDPTMVQGSDYYYITTRNPSETAINSALDRLLGKSSTKIVGANNPDGSEGPIKVVVANFSAPVAHQSLTTYPTNTIDSPPPDPSPALEASVLPAIEEAIQEAVEEDEVAHQPPPSDEGYSTTNYGN